jgi:hypothetical protein
MGCIEDSDSPIERVFIRFGGPQGHDLQANRVAFWIGEVISGQHLLHFECLPRATGDDPLGPPFDRLTFLAPVFVDWIPYATVLQPEKGQS